MKLFITFLLAIFSSSMVYAQLGRGVIKGEVTDAESGEPLPFVIVVLKDTASQFVLKATTDFDGIYTLKPIESGEFSIEFHYVGYLSDTIENVLVKDSYVRLVDVTIKRTDEIHKVKPMAPRNPNYKLNSVRGERVLKSYSPAQIEKSTGEASLSKEQDPNLIYSRCGIKNTIKLVEGVRLIDKQSSDTPTIKIDETKLRGVSACYENKEAKFNRDLKYLLY